MTNPKVSFTIYSMDPGHAVQAGSNQKRMSVEILPGYVRHTTEAFSRYYHVGAKPTRILPHINHRPEFQSTNWWPICYESPYMLQGKPI